MKTKDPAAVALGRAGGKASAEMLTKEQRTEKARKAAMARWKNVQGPGDHHFDLDKQEALLEVARKTINKRKPEK